MFCHTFGPIVAAGVGVYLLMAPERRRGVWVVVFPLLLWIAWWLWARKIHQDATEASNVGGAPWFVLQSIGVSIESLFGLGSRFGGGSSTYTAIATPVAALLGLGWLAAVGVAWPVAERGAGPSPTS